MAMDTFWSMQIRIDETVNKADLDDGNIFFLK